MKYVNWDNNECHKETVRETVWTFAFLLKFDDTPWMSMFSSRCFICCFDFLFYFEVNPRQKHTSKYQGRILKRRGREGPHWVKTEVLISSEYGQWLKLLRRRGMIRTSQQKACVTLPRGLREMLHLQYN